MTAARLHRLVARATGERLPTIRRLGFQLADPLVVRYDPEPSEANKAVEFTDDTVIEPADAQTVDWDALEEERTAFFPLRRSAPVAA